MPKDVEYIDLIDDDDPYGERTISRPKWMLPKNEFEQRVLAVFGRKYFKDRKNEASPLRFIEAEMLPFNTNPANPPHYPTEWVEDLLEWAKKKRHEGQFIPLINFIRACQNEDRRQEWVEQMQMKYKKQEPTPMPVAVVKGKEVHRGTSPQYTDSMDQ